MLNNILNTDITSILNFGFIGLAFLFAYLSYRLISNLVKQPNVEPIKVGMLAFYLVLCLALGGGGFYLEVNKSDGPLSGFMTDRITSTFFKSGQDAKILEGEWDAIYFEQIAKDGIDPQLDKFDSILDTISFKVDSTFLKLPAETIRIRSRDSGFVLESVGLNTLSREQFRLWGIGRISTTKDVTFSYWSAKADEFDNRIGEEIYSGINFLRLIPGTAIRGEQYPFAKGIWMGRNTYGKVVFGLTFWKKREVH